MIRSVLIIIILFLLIVKPIQGKTGIEPDTTDYYKEGFFRYENFIYQKNIRTVQLYPQNWELQEPIILLGRGEMLELHFDDLDTDYKNYKFTFIHCNADWQPSTLSPFDYISGYPDDNVYDYRFSQNTFQTYTHYKALFPNENTRITRSGNYVLVVFTDDKDKPAFTHRFCIAEEKAFITGRAKVATIVEERSSSHEVDFTIRYLDLQIPNPYADLKVVVTQNGRWDNAIRKLKPTFARDNELVYDYETDNLFKAGNDFRNFDIKTLRFMTEFVKNVETTKQGTHVYLKAQPKRAFRRYGGGEDINGAFVVRNQDGREPTVDADYVWVHFQLDWEEEVAHGNIYISGALAGWNYRPEFKMKYNIDKRAYEAVVLLKQGYYNYEYMFWEDGQKAADITFVEGSHSASEQNYTVRAYLRDQNMQYDRLVGVKMLNSGRDF